MQDVATRAAEREKTLRLESEMAQMPQVTCPVVHHFAPGVYVRECHLPADVLVVGATHKTEHLSMLIKGKVIVTTDDGMQTIVAPATFLSKPGIKRVCYAVEDSIFSTIHVTNTTDLAALAIEITDLTLDQLAGGENNIATLAAKLRESLS